MHNQHWKKVKSNINTSEEGNDRVRLPPDVSPFYIPVCPGPQLPWEEFSADPTRGLPCPPAAHLTTPHQGLVCSFEPFPSRANCAKERQHAQYYEKKRSRMNYPICRGGQEFEYNLNAKCRTVYAMRQKNKKECPLDTFHKQLSQYIRCNRNRATLLGCSEFPGCVWPKLDVSSRQCVSCHKTKVCEIVTDSCLFIVNHKDSYYDQIYSPEEGNSRRPFLL